MYTSRNRTFVCYQAWVCVIYGYENRFLVLGIMLVSYIHTITWYIRCFSVDDRIGYYVKRGYIYIEGRLHSVQPKSKQPPPNQNILSYLTNAKQPWKAHYINIWSFSFSSTQLFTSSAHSPTHHQSSFSPSSLPYNTPSRVLQWPRICQRRSRQEMIDFDWLFYHKADTM